MVTMHVSCTTTLNAVFPFIRFVCRGASILRGNEACCFIEISVCAWKGGGKNPVSTNKYTKFGQLIIRKIIEIVANRFHILG